MEKRTFQHSSVDHLITTNFIRMNPIVKTEGRVHWSSTFLEWLKGLQRQRKNSKPARSRKSAWFAGCCTLICPVGLADHFEITLVSDLFWISFSIIYSLFAPGRRLDLFLGCLGVRPSLSIKCQQGKNIEDGHHIIMLKYFWKIHLRSSISSPWRGFQEYNLVFGLVHRCLNIPIGVGFHMAKY